MKSNRMFGILAILLDKKKTTAKELADYFEVSVRTIHRDLLDLSSAGFPVISQQGIGGGVSLLPCFTYDKSVLTEEDMDMILTGIQGLSSIEDSSNLKTLLAKLQFNRSNKMLLENDVIIDFTSWNNKSNVVDKIKIIRKAISRHNLLSMDYYGVSGNYQRTIEPYKLIFKEENWYLFGYCRYKEDFRIFKINRIVNLHICDESFIKNDNYTIPSMESHFANKKGIHVIAKMDNSLEFLAIDYFGLENIKKVNDDIYVSFLTENKEWIIRTFARFGNKAEIISPDSLRIEMSVFLEQAQNLYKT